ncbi:MAG: DUF6452 family protein [Bacteroidaceae bacterium]|nr:DUF6452 family protein [Bacteroidaceae bacterium]
MNFRTLILFFSVMVGLAACTSIECPMNSHVFANYGFYINGDTAVAINGLTVTTTRNDGNDTTLVNKLSGSHNVTLPMSFIHDTDTLRFTLADETGEQTDVMHVKKTNEMHFESVECGANYFHKILSIETTHNFIDSVVIKKDNVNYDATEEHVHIYLKR